MLHFLFPLTHMYSAWSLDWSQLVDTQSWPSSTLKTVGGSDLGQNIWRKPSYLPISHHLLLVPVHQAPRSCMCERGGVVGEPGSPLGLGPRLPRVSTLPALPLRLCCGECSWGGAVRDWPAGCWVTVSPQVSFCFPTIPGSPCTLSLLPPTLSSSTAPCPRSPLFLELMY